MMTSEQIKSYKDSEIYKDNYEFSEGDNSVL